MAKKDSADLKRLYRELGYTGSLEAKPRKRGLTPRRTKADQDLPPLDPDGLANLETLLRERPEEFLQDFRESHQMPLTDDELRQAFAETRQAFDDPTAYVETRRAARRQAKSTRQRGPSAGIPAAIQIYDDLKIEPDNHKFEPHSDIVGWIVNSGYQYVFRERLKIGHYKDTFRSHADHAGGFVYAMKSRDGRPADPEQKISVALFGDFGSGLDHSRFIARHISTLQPDYAIHLGDVYYSGRSFEFEKYFNAPLAPVMQNSRLFALNANHEMLSGAKPYFYSMDQRRRQAGGPAQEQEGSYFCIRGPRHQIIGIDTAFHTIGRHNVAGLNQWLRQCLQEGKNASPPCVNILLSQNEPFALGNNKFTEVYDDLKPLIDGKLIDFWFWGNKHYGALFGPSLKAPFVGSCVGHAGHPIYQKEIATDASKHAELLRRNNALPPALWVETGTKFPNDIPGWPNPRPEMGNHGFCLMDLEKDKIKLTYYDWLQKVRHVAEFPV